MFSAVQKRPNGGAKKALWAAEKGSLGAPFGLFQNRTGLGRKNGEGKCARQEKTS